jgi:hypothetical protein
MDKNTTMIVGALGLAILVYLFYTGGLDEIGENAMFVAVGMLGGLLLAGYI